MHRVDTKKRRATVLRLAAYGITILLSTLTTVVLLYVALGYRLDRQSGHLVRSGLLLVDNKPQAAAIYINNELRDNTSPGRFVLTAGNYDLKLSLNGYRDWSKQVEVSASGVREVNYPLLVPTTLKAGLIGEVEPPYLVSQSLDRKLLLLHGTNQPELTLITLKSEELERTAVALPSSVERESGNLGTFRMIEWALDNKHVLLEQTLPSGRRQILSIDATRPAETVNISGLYGDQTPQDIHYVGGNTELIYGVHSGSLRRYSLKAAESEKLLQNIRSYQPYGTDTILFDRQTSSGAAEVGIWKDGATTVVQSPAAGESAALLKYAAFEDHAYFAVATPGADKVTIYRDPLKNPLRAKQTPFITLAFDSPQKIDFSDSAQFLLAQNGKHFLTYDFEDFKQHAVTLPFEIVAGGRLSWLDAHHLQVMREDGTMVLMDYDGTNRQELVKAAAGTRLYFANNYEYAYRFLESETQTKIDLVDFVAN